MRKSVSRRLFCQIIVYYGQTLRLGPISNFEIEVCRSETQNKKKNFQCAPRKLKKKTSPLSAVTRQKRIETYRVPTLYVSVSCRLSQNNFINVFALLYYLLYFLLYYLLYFLHLTSGPSVLHTLLPIPRAFYLP